MGRLIRLLENKTVLLFAGLALVLSGIFFWLGYSATVHAQENSAAEMNDRILVASVRIKELAPSLTDEQIAAAFIDKSSPDEAADGEKILGSYGFRAGSGRSRSASAETSLLPAAAAAAGVSVCGIAALLFLCLLIRNIRKVSESAEKKEQCSKHFSDHDLILLCDAVNGLANEYGSVKARLSEEKHFLADHLQDLSHQIKTPAAGLTLNNEIYRTHSLPKEELDAYLERDRICIERINKLCSESLKLARLEAGAVNYDIGRHHLSEIADKACAPIYEIAAVNSTDLSVDISPEIQLDCDELWLSEAISNLVKNACEHTHGGSVTVTAAEDPFTVSLYITDDGEGIPDEDVPHVFKRFYSKKAESNPTSVGIGLAISKQITEDLGGKIYIDTVLGKGTNIRVQFLKKAGS